MLLKVARVDLSSTNARNFCLYLREWELHSNYYKRIIIKLRGFKDHFLILVGCTYKYEQYKDLIDTNKKVIYCK